MRIVTLAALASLLFGGTALAAELPVKGPIYRAPPATDPSWTGFYLGGNVGWDFEHHHSTNVGTIGSVNFPIGFSSSIDMNGILGGVQMGFDWQFDQHWLVGIGGDFDWTDVKADSIEHGVINPAVVSHFHDTYDWLSTVTARFGYVGNSWLLYIKGGGAWGRANFSSVTNNAAGMVTTIAGGSNTRSGWTVGGGIEDRFAGNWSAFLEYDYVNFPTTIESSAVTFGTVAPVLTGTTLLRDRNAHMNVVKVGLNYRF